MRFQTSKNGTELLAKTIQTYQKTSGTVAAGHQKTAEAGAEMFKQGGNAFDAALAAMLASCIAEPTTTTAGGGGFLLAHTSAGDSTLFDFFTQTPSSKKHVTHPDFFPVSINFGATNQTFHVGMGSIAVPGFVAGILRVHQRLGKLPLSVIAAPAIEFARKGIEITPYQYSAFEMLSPITLLTDVGKNIYLSNGQLLAAGSTFQLPQYADFLELLIKEGSRPFYEGDIAQFIAKTSQEKGGYLSLNDFKNYQVIERKPLTYRFNKNVLLTNPPPCSGGILIAFTLALLQQKNTPIPPFGTAEHVALLANLLANTIHARKNELDKHIYENDYAKQFLSDKFLANYQNNNPFKRGCTTHISAMDEHGNAAGVTTSHGEGCGVYMPHTQVMLNNMLGEEDLNPNGFHTWAENVRLSSMMSPSIVLNEQNRPVIVTGTGGANRIRTAIFQVLHNLIHHRMTIKDAVNAPRMHWENNQLFLEPNFVKEAYELSHLGKLTTWEEPSMFFGGAHSVALNREGRTGGVGDSRRDGVAITV